MNIEKNQQARMCIQCKTFFGAESNGWLCSGCYKSKNGTAKVVAKKEEPIKAVEPVKEEPPAKPLQEDKTRCWRCNKKVGLLGTNCKCSFTFCNLHRLPEDHDCDVDYRKLGKQQLEKKVERVASRKVSEI